MSDEKQITLPDSKVTLTLRKPRMSSAALMKQLEKKYPKPQAPVLEQKVLGKAERFVNYADPDYKEALATWSRDQAFKLMAWLTELSVVMPDAETIKQDVAPLRESMAVIIEDESDRDVWFNFYAIQSDLDFQVLSKAAGELMGATEEQIQAEIENFRANT